MVNSCSGFCCLHLRVRNDRAGRIGHRSINCSTKCLGICCKGERKKYDCQKENTAHSSHPLFGLESNQEYTAPPRAVSFSPFKNDSGSTERVPHSFTESDHLLFRNRPRARMAIPAIQGSWGCCIAETIWLLMEVLIPKLGHVNRNEIYFRRRKNEL